LLKTSIKRSIMRSFAKWFGLSFMFDTLVAVIYSNYFA
jgi:cbb3-type cytochrome oxidase subunit 3